MASVEERITLVTRQAEEVVKEEELRTLLQERDRPRAYIGFEPSGLAHLGWMICANKVRDLTDAGFAVTIFLADWHAHINNKLDGDLEKIRICGQYMEQAMIALGVDPEHTNMVYASELVSRPGYWKRVINIMKHTTIARMKKATTIMGRIAEETDRDTSMLLYPAMQVADIYELDVDLALGGLDQRSAHMLARDVAEKLGWTKPVALHTPLLPSLKSKGGRMDPIEAKMSKSDPEAGLSIHDSPKQIKKKINKAFCPPTAEENPVLDIARYLLFRDGALRIERPEKFGGDLNYDTYEELEQAFVDEKLHPADLKRGVGAAVARLLAPVTAEFEDNPGLLEQVRAFTITR